MKKKNSKYQGPTKIPHLLQLWNFGCQNFFTFIIFLLKTFIVIKVYTVLSTTEIVLDIKIGI